MRSLVPSTPEGASSGAELVTTDGRALALASATLRGEAQGGLARLVLEQRFENPHDEILRVTYRMPLPADGAVSGYEFVIGERVVKGVIDRKRQARERFERAIVEGKTAALLEQERADIFTQQIGNIPPREAVVARITIDQRLVWLPEGEWELRFPTVIGPRYIGSADSPADARATHVKVSDRPLGVRIQIELAIRDAIVAGAKPSSPSHALEKREDGTIELVSGARLDRDIVVRWPVATPAVGLSLTTARPAAGGDAYGLLAIVPPAKAAKVRPVARDLVVLFDTSGSMGGGPIDKAKQVLALMIDSLGEHDRLELIEFSNEPRRYKDEPVVATAKAKQDAIKWVRSRVADGGTEMRTAVIEALQTLRIGAQRQVVVVTDGYVGGEQQILEALHRRLPKSCRLHVLGVGSAVNRSLATSLARAGRGAEVLVGLDEDAERGAKRLLDRTRLPMLTNVEIAGSALLRHAPEQLPDVFEGAPLVAALALRPDGGELVVRGQLADETWEQRLVMKPQRAGDGNQAIVALYGRERVADLESHAMFDSVDGEIEDLGLTFQIATRMTSWVAIDETRVVKGPVRDELVPQELPYGTTAAAFGLRGAAAPVARALAMPQMRTQAELVHFEEEASADLDHGEEGPSEISEARSMIQGASFDRDDGVLGGMPGAEADFEHEEPTGQTADKAAELSRSSARRRSAPPSPAAPPAARSAPPAARSAPMRPRPTPAPSSTPPEAPKPVTKTLAAPEPEPTPAPMWDPKPGSVQMAEPKQQAKDEAKEKVALAAPERAAQQAPVKARRKPYSLIVLAILALLAALLWWLLA